MSLYPQNLYGQPSYGGPSYASPPSAPTGYHYYQQQPQQPSAHTYHVDAASFRRDFAARLSELTFNSRPIIQQLSMYAQDYSRFSDIVAQCLEVHIRRVPPWMKLPAFYLLDAISKNVYEPYARRFSSFVVPLYLESYPAVDENTKGKMEEMLLTWRTGAPSGKELFGAQQQGAIERGVWGSGGVILSNSKFHSGVGIVTKSQVLSELQFTLGQKERALQANPYDTLSQNHITVLNQLRLHIEAGVSQDELRQILAQLRNLVKSAPPPPIPQPSIPAASSWLPQPPLQPHFPSQLPYSRPSSAVVKAEEQASNLSATDVQPLPATSTIVPPDNLTNLLSTLLKAGVLSTNATPEGAGATSKEQDVPLETQKTTQASDQLTRDYRDAILSDVINLNNLDLARPPRIVEFLHDHQGLQCRQCGIRFADTQLGKKNQNDHLDMHFRQNRKASDNLGRGHSRSWFVGLEDWTHDISGGGNGNDLMDGSGPRNTKASAAAEIAKREADLRAQYVIVPPGEEAQVMSCPICKETLKSEFLEDDEDWVWKNATKKEDKIYHATCYAEAITSTSTLAARLRSEKAHGSRSATPEVPMSEIATVRGTPPPQNMRKSKSPSMSPSRDGKVIGTKRKVEHSDSNISQEGGSTPPLKKVAMSVSS